METKKNEGPVAARYGVLEADRYIYLQRAREAAQFTLPMLFPPQGHSSATRYPTPYQSLGARGCNQLASKLLMTLFPPEQSFFRLLMDEKIADELTDDEEDVFEAALSNIEQAVMREVGARGIRARMHEGLLALIIGGNTLLYLPKPKKKTGKGKARVFRLDQFVVARDHEGNVLEIVVKESLSPQSLPDSVRQQVLDKLKMDEAAEKATGDDGKTRSTERTIDLYTYVYLDDQKWKVEQEVKGIDIPESHGTYPFDSCPWFPLRWKAIDGENYGRGYCEEYIGDLASLEGLSKALIEGGAVLAKILFLVDPNGVTRQEDLAEAPNGAIRAGKAEEVTVLQAQKTADLGFVVNLRQQIEQRLSYAFLLNSAVQRDAERVTAEEIRLMAQELEDALGGVYSQFAEELQLPLAMLVMHQMEGEGELPDLPDGTVHPAIVAGLDALGRNHELNRLDEAMDGALQRFGPQVMPFINMSDYLTRRFAALGIKTKGLIRSQDEVDQANQQADQQDMQKTIAPHAIKAGAQIATTAMQQQGQQQAGNQGTTNQ